MLHDTKHDLSQDSQDLLNAADYIDQHGWCQRITSLGKSVCLWGSLLAVTDGLGKFYSDAPRAKALYDKVNNYLGDYAAPWNDMTGRTKAEVTALLREVALKSKE